MLLAFAPLDQAFFERTAWIIRLLRSVTNEELFFNGVVQIAGLLEGADVNLQEGVQPARLFNNLRSVSCLATCNRILTPGSRPNRVVCSLNDGPYRGW